MSTEWTMTVDCAHPPTLAAFWRLALGYVDAAPPAGFASWDVWFERFDVPPEERDGLAAIEDPNGVRPRISFLQVPEAKTVKNRLHLDLQVGGGRAQPWEVRWPKVLETVERLTAAGATQQAVIYDEGPGGKPDHVVMLDPEGNEFCVV